MNFKIIMNAAERRKMLKYKNGMIVFTGMP